MKQLITIVLVLAPGGSVLAAPRVWLEGADMPEALMVSNDSGTELAGCVAEWTITYENGDHYTEVAMVDLPANGDARVTDCNNWWDERRSKKLDVRLKLYGPDKTLLAEHAQVFTVVQRQGLPTDGWSAKASRGPNVAAAYDGELRSRWDTAGFQQAGDWYTLDMGKVQRFAGLIIDSRQSANDYPSGLKVEASQDGENWSLVVDVPDTEPFNKGGKVTLGFDAVEARYIRLTLTKPHGERWYWSIHELSVLPPQG